MKKELESTLGDLSVKRLRSVGFAQAIQSYAQAMFDGFRRIYEELGSHTIHPLDLEGEGLFDRYTAWQRTKVMVLLDVIHEGCDHVSHLSSSKFNTSENLYAEVSEAAGAAANEMLDRMWVAFGCEFARKCLVAELERVGVRYYDFGLFSLLLSDISVIGEESL